MESHNGAGTKMNLQQWIAKIGENPNFIAFMAHAGVAGFLLMCVPYTWFALALLTLAVIKEFWFDLKYETTPPQTWENSLLDLAGYGFGLILATIRINL